jgi:hypothetical protein
LGIKFSPSFGIIIRIRYSDSCLIEKPGRGSTRRAFVRLWDLFYDALLVAALRSQPVAAPFNLFQRRFSMPSQFLIDQRTPSIRERPVLFDQEFSHSIVVFFIGDRESKARFFRRHGRALCRRSGRSGKPRPESSVNTWLLRKEAIA